ncbi:hypothetical protein IU433_12405 [Nocardia puris]|uniref:hypothetical protein n=1 Tax=Nocardia puris TaxID=208602 RepID=UPI001895BBD6|nr:hypothetical protein [Nocardia puris]MBF6459839.1 hypothetical protein [Nocardia puris]
MVSDDRMSPAELADVLDLATHAVMLVAAEVPDSRRSAQLLGAAVEISLVASLLPQLSGVADLNALLDPVVPRPGGS